MRFWILVAISLLLLWACQPREHYVEQPGPGTRPSLSDGAWRSKIEAEAPIGGNTWDYEVALQSFYDTVYAPLRKSNATASVPAAQVETFIRNQPSNIEKSTLRRIITAGFAVDKGETAAAREEKQVNTEGALKGFKAKGGSEAIEPKDGVDGTWPQYANKSDYIPADPRLGQLSEGIYTPVEQQEEPRREGIYDDKSTSWTDTKFYGICEGEKCSKNVL